MDEPEDQKRQEIEEDEDAITESDENDIWITALKSLDLEAWKPSVREIWDMIPSAVSGLRGDFPNIDGTI